MRLKLFLVCLVLACVDGQQVRGQDAGSVELASVRELGKWHRSRESAVYSEIAFPLGKRLREGEGCRQDHMHANNIFNAVKRNQQSHLAEASYQVGLAYENGWGVNRDEDRAFQFYDEAADYGSEPAAKRRADISEKRFERLVKEYGAGAEAVAIELYGKRDEKSGVFGAKPPGFTDRMARLGGPRPPKVSNAQDKVEGEAARGDAEAQWILGLCYLLGRDVNAFGDKPREYKADEAKAFEWFLKSAEQGYLPACARVGEAYFFGKGTKVDPKQAREWLEKASQDKEWSGSLAKILLKQYEPAATSPAK